MVIGEWSVDQSTSTIVGPSGEKRLEPKVMDLLVFLMERDQSVSTRDEIMAALWPGVIVGEDVLARTVSKLRTVLGDEARAPTYIETIPKRGYRMMRPALRVEPESVVLADDDQANMTISPEKKAITSSIMRHRWLALALICVVLSAWVDHTFWSPRPVPTSVHDDPASSSISARLDLLAHADDAYFQFTRADNEAAIDLYQRLLSIDPDDVPALAGLANALVQRCIRWPSLVDGHSPNFTQLRDALANGHLASGENALQLKRARALAERAVALDPRSSGAHKALGFVAAAQSAFDEALREFETSVSLDANAWGALINIFDVLEITGRADKAQAYLEQAFEAMARSYDQNPAQIRPWLAAVGVLIAERHAERLQVPSAESWYRRVLLQSPLHPTATRGLAALLRANGDSAEANRLCAELAQRVGEQAGCAE